MPALRFCRSCAGPRPRAARRCPWCHRDYDGPTALPEHLFDAPGGRDGFGRKETGDQAR